MIETIDSPYIHAGSAENFEALVLRNSNQGPVLVNFWSKKAGPCLRQYPVLDKLIHDYGGRLLLVNVDADAEVKITGEYGIASLPTLKLFRREEVVETLHGYQSEAELINRLNQYVARDSDQLLADAIAGYSRGDQQQAYASLSDAIVNDTANPRLPIALCKLLKHERRYSEALTFLASLPHEIGAMDEVNALRDELGFMLIADNITDVEALIEQAGRKPDDLHAKVELSAFYILNGDFGPALQLLVEIMEIEQGYHDNYAQKSMLKIFDRLGRDHELVKQFRPNLLRYTH
jgi:putative thioredoxin